MVHNGSTGNIMLNISKLLCKRGDYTQTLSAKIYSKRKINLPLSLEHHSYVGIRCENFIHTSLGQLTGLNGCFSHLGTHRLIKECKKFNPDVIHLHNLHAFCINLPMLFRYVKKNNIPVVWTLHDCWTFTGHCPYFDLVNCDKWKTECHNCPQLSVYPKSRVDNTRIAHKLKKKWFLGVENMTLVTPSEWLGDLAKESFLKDYPVKVIHNGIDLSVFKPTESDFREKHGLTDKKVILGVASDWGKRKGLDVFKELADRLDDDYRIVLVGLDAATENLPKKITTVKRTENQKELAEIYTAADLFVNPTREENYPTVNMESLSCGTPVLTFRTGGSPEIPDETCGSVVEVDNVDAMEKEIIRICEEKPYSKEACLERAKKFDMYDRFEEYIELYKEVINK
jgi:glycosyltransferase involved in cell wall biosynthesis